MTARFHSVLADHERNPTSEAPRVAISRLKGLEPELPSNEDLGCQSHGAGDDDRGGRWLATLMVAVLLPASTPFAVDAGAELQDDDPQGQVERPTGALVEELSRALGMTPADVEALGLSPAEVRGLLAGFAEETVVVGSRAEPRSATESAVPVDVLSAADLVSRGAGDLKDQLRTIVPSFSVNSQPISGASTVVRPAMLRNLAPDHTLVLVNGKRRHRSSIVDWSGGNGVAFGSQGPDVSVIPAIALRQVEVLRDGAAAQYGSDAIAGVMNFRLKDARSGGSMELGTGMYRAGDGETARFAGNVGLPLGAAGFANLSLEYGNANRTDRGAPRRDAMALIAAGNTHVVSDRPQAWGDPQVDDDLKLFGNFGYTLPAGVEAYAHTSYASRTVTLSVFYRNPNTRLGVFSNDRGRTLLVGDVLAARGMGSADCPTVTVTDNLPDPVTLRQVFDDPNCFTFQEVFPGGFTPQRIGTPADASLVGGLRGSTAGGFAWDLSGSLGVHRTDFFTATPSTRRSVPRRPTRSMSARPGSGTSTSTSTRRTRSATGSTSPPGRSGATSSTASAPATARAGRSAPTRRSASWRVPMAPPPTARRRRAPGTAATSRPTATSR